jgi:hypothetical protein
MPEEEAVTYRPYPNVDRSLRQVARHAIPVELPEWRVKLAADARRALRAAEGALQPLAVLPRARHTAVSKPDCRTGLVT